MASPFLGDQHQSMISEASIGGQSLFPPVAPLSFVLHLELTRVRTFLKHLLSAMECSRDAVP